MENNVSFIDRREENIPGGAPTQITPSKKDIIGNTPHNKVKNFPTPDKDVHDGAGISNPKSSKTKKRQPKANETISSKTLGKAGPDSKTSNSKSPKTPGKKNSKGNISSSPVTPGKERSEVNIEIKGYKETNLTPKSKVTSSTVRTVYRSSSGSASDSKESVTSPTPGEEDIPVFSNDVSHKKPTEVIDGGVWYLHRQTSESYFISQQYQLEAKVDSPSRSVTAIPQVTFKSSRVLGLTGSHGSSSSSTDGNAGSPGQVSDKDFDSDSPTTVSQFIFDSLDDGTSFSTLSDGKLDSSQEEVQQIIQSSYMVSDITDVINDSEMTSDSQTHKSAVSVESSVDALEAPRSPSLSAQLKSYSLSSPTDDKVVVKKRETHSVCSKSQELASISTYSPGLAIRSYALEELAEKKLRPEPAPQIDGMSMRFDSESSKVDIDSGTSVDNVNVPHLKMSNFLQRQQSPGNKSTLQSQPKPNSSPFTIQRVHKVNLSDHASVSTKDAKDMMTEEERLESEDRLDSLVDINAIQAAYRFHDVGMMLDTGGICNPAFDESSDLDSRDSNQPYISSEDMRAKGVSQEKKQIIAPVFSMSTSSALSSSPSVLKAPPKQTSVSENDSQNHSVENSHSFLPASEDSSQNVIGDVGFLLKSAPSAEDYSTSLPSKRGPTQKLTTSPGSGANLIQSTSTTLKPTITEKTQREPEVAKPEPIPVTRRFTPTKKFESVLKSHGARLISETLVIDVYYDTPAFHLTLNDCWLRTHNGTWQSHAGFTTLFNQDKNYHEKEDQAQLISFVASAIGRSSEGGKSFPSVGAFVHRMGLCEYVRYRTVQKSYDLDGMAVHLELPEHGFCVGSVTTMAPGLCALHEGLNKMDDFWKKAGVKPLSLLCA